MRKLFKERKLFKGGNYMRKYGIWNLCQLWRLLKLWEIQRSASLCATYSDDFYPFTSDFLGSIIFFYMYLGRKIHLNLTNFFDLIAVILTILSSAKLLCRATSPLIHSSSSSSKFFPEIRRFLSKISECSTGNPVRFRFLYEFLINCGTFIR